MSVADLILLADGVIVGSVLAAVAGFGGAAVLLPLLAAVFGVREAIPILTVAQLLGNLSRAWFNRSELDLPVVGWFALTGVPAAPVGGFLFASAGPESLGARLAITYCRHARRDRMTYSSDKVYEAHQALGLARVIPTEWFLQEIRD